MGGRLRETPDTMWRQELPSAQSYFGNVAKWRGLLNSSDPAAILHHFVVLCSFQNSPNLTPWGVVLGSCAEFLASCFNEGERPLFIILRTQFFGYRRIVISCV